MAAKQKTLLNRIYDARFSYLFIAPLIIGLLIFSYFPAIYSLILAFYDKSSTSEAVFVRFDNFIRLFQDEVFLNSIPVMLKIQLPKLVIGIVMPLIMAELIFALRSRQLQSISRILILLPIVAPGVVGMLIWRNLLSADGIFTIIARLFGIVGSGDTINWLNDPDIVVFSVILIGFPWIGGTSTLIYMSGLMNISTEVIEASKLDGLDSFRRIFYIDLPLLVGQIRYFLIFGLIGAFQDYSIQFTLTDGGPGYSTYVPGWYMYQQAFSADNMGYASAISTVIFIVILLITALCFRYMNMPGLKNKKRDEV